MDALYHSDEIYLIEKKIETQLKIPMALLMQRAGYVLFKAVPENAKHIFIFIGPGNNGGDGIVAASFLKQFNFDVTVIHLMPLNQCSELSKQMLTHAKALGVIFKPFNLDHLEKLKKHNKHNITLPDVIIDAIFGIGLSKAPKGHYLDAIDWINQSGAYIISADCPSGLSANTGAPIGCAVKANQTCQFLAKKQGLYTEIAATYTGIVHFDPLGIDFSQIKIPKPKINLLTENDIKNHQKERPLNSHKGTLGHVVIIGGDTGMGGAAILNAFSALKTGAGKVTLLTQKEHITASLSFVPEVMVKGITIEDNINLFLEKGDVFVIGSGMDLNLSWSKHFFKLILEKNIDKPNVFDAGMLHYLATIKSLKQTKQKQIVITPHLGEAALLLNTDIPSIQNDRFSSIKALTQKYKATTILKGRGSLIQSPNTAISLCFRGNPYMATAGMGDLLTGMVASLIAQGYPLQIACELAVWEHASKADALLKAGKIPLIASEILAE